MGADTATAGPARSIELDFTRGVAILLAVGWHFNARDTGIPVIDWLLLPGRTFGWAGVDLFFVLSGFLVGGLVFTEYRDTGAFRARRFLVRRAFKIWPVLYAYVLLLVLTGRYAARDIVPQTLFHVQNYFVTPASHLWSLAVEEHFYTLFAIAFTLFQRRHIQRRQGIPLLLFGLMVGVLILRVVSSVLGVGVGPLQGQTQFRIDALACGVLLAYLKVFEPTSFERMAARKLLLSCVVAAGVVLLTVVARDRFMATIGATCVYVSAAAFLLFTYRLPAIAGASWFARLVAWIGTYSYAMYVFQFVPFRAGEALWNRWVGLPMPPLTELLLRYVGAVVLAIVVTRLLERPMLKLRDRWFPGLRAPVRPPQVVASSGGR